MNLPSSEDEISDSSRVSVSPDSESSELSSISSSSVSIAYAIGTVGEKKQPMYPPLGPPELCCCFWKNRYLWNVKNSKILMKFISSKMKFTFVTDLISILSLKQGGNRWYLFLNFSTADVIDLCSSQAFKFPSKLGRSPDRLNSVFRFFST